jgi:hypothetical protein
MAATGWHRLIPPDDLYRGEGRYPIDAYSEFLPAPRLRWKPYLGHQTDTELFEEDDPFGWHVNESEEALEMRLGLQQIGKQIMNKLARLLDGNPETGLPKLDLMHNPFWPPALAAEPRLPQERCVALMPLAFSRTQDDKGRVVWTLFGVSEQGPGRAFWKSFFTAPKKEVPIKEGLAFFSRLLRQVYAVKAEGRDGLLKAGFRILPDPKPLLQFWKEAPLPRWTKPFVLNERGSISRVKYLLTFRPFDNLPEAVRKAYLAGDLCLLPFPGSLTFWGVPAYRELHRELPLALQIPLLLNIARHHSHAGLRVPQSGFMHEPTAERPHAPHHTSHIRNTYRRTHRWDKVLRDQDELALIGKEDKLLHVLFSTVPEDVDLYDKPMARNVQLWTESAQLLLDGPKASPEQIKHAMRAVQGGGLFGYRFLFPAMRVGRHEVYWHRPLVAYRNRAGEALVISDGPSGYLTAYDTDKPDFERPLEFWPRLRHRPVMEAALAMQEPGCAEKVHALVRQVRRLVDAFNHREAEPLPRSLAQAMLRLRHGETLESWLSALPNPTLVAEVPKLIQSKTIPLPTAKGAKVPDSLTYHRSAKRAFEVTYWKTIAELSEGTLLNKNNADCILDETTRRMLPYHDRHLEDLGEYLLAYYTKRIAAAGLTGKALAGEVPFRWRTDLDYSWMGGWRKNQEMAAERDLLIVIPGRDRKRAIIMGDHYDTAYMADRYYKEIGGCGARIAACGADDNHSATAAMMLAAPIFLEMSKQRQLGCDIWLVHLTGEEFPADCLGARALTQRLVEGTLKLHLPGGKVKDFSDVEIKGLYVSDMIAHNNDHERDVFQISPGTGRESLELAYQAHIANEIWNESVAEWNKDPERSGRPRGRRSPHGAAIPEVAPLLPLCGQVRPVTDPRSTLYNTDGQIFSDAGVPCVLFMENYDINRQGYHDTHDTMANIDLDYGSAVCAITIEAVARATHI